VNIIKIPKISNFKTKLYPPPHAMVLSPLCPTSFNVRPYGTTPTQDNMLSPMARHILNLEKLRMEKERRDDEVEMQHQK